MGGFRMSRWNLLGYCAIAGLLCTLAACGKKETPAESNANESGMTQVIQAPSKPIVVGQNERLELDFYVEAPALDGEPAGLPANNSKFQPSVQSQVGSISDSIALDSGIISTGQGGRGSDLSLPGLNGRSGPTRRTGVLMAIKPGVNLGAPVALNVEARAGQPDKDVNTEAESSTENYQPIFENPYKTVKQDPLSTFSSSVDTASYSNLRARLNDGKLPHKDMVRIADMLNYFNYDYAGPKNDEPVAFTLEIAPCPWQPKHQLLRIGLKAKTIDKDKMPPRNLTFLIDTSGSMNQENRLPLVKKSLQLLVEQLTDKDMVSIVTYAGNAGVALLPTPGSKKDEILKKIESFNAEGSTNGEGGLLAAYEQAKASFIKGGVNRVILATDGDFNVGVSSDAELVRLIEAKRETGIYLTVLGYGMGNLKDSKLEQLAHHGNGHYAYIDTLDEAKKVFVEQGGSLATVAKDVKLQVEFNPTKVSAYRLVGYENRVMRNEDFRNDTKDAGDMGSGHTCTALYEIVPVGEKVDVPPVEPLKYQTVPTPTEKAKSGEFLTVRMRFKHPETNKASEVEAALPAEALGRKVSNDFEFAACVASFGMILRDSEYRGVATYASTLETAEGLLRDKKDSYREVFARLVRVALTIEQAQPKKQ